MDYEKEKPLFWLIKTLDTTMLEITQSEGEDKDDFVDGEQDMNIVCSIRCCCSKMYNTAT